MHGSPFRSALFVLSVLAGAPVSAQTAYLDMRVSVVDDTGTLEQIDLFRVPQLEQTLYLSASRTLGDGSTALAESEAHASLRSGVIYLRNNCPSTSGCAGDTSWFDSLTFDATGLPPGETITLTVIASVSGTFGPTTATRYTLSAQSIANVTVLGTLFARVDYFNTEPTTTANSDAFQVLEQIGSWSAFGPESFIGELPLMGGAINTVNIESLIVGDTEMALLATMDLTNTAGLGFSSNSGAFLSVETDTDADGIDDILDNCTAVPNAAQRDTDGDGIGNRCDGDFDNNCTVDFADLAYLKGVFFSSDADGDLDGDGMVTFLDLSIFKDQIFAAPGPSGRPNVCD